MLASLPVSERDRLLAALSDRTAAQLNYDWSFHARRDQLLPGTSDAAIQRKDWRYWLCLAGRGWGKTRVGSETVRQWSRDFPLVNLIGATLDDARDIMIEGESGVLAVCPDGERPRYRNRQLLWPNGARSLVFTADEPDRLRGKQHMKLWADELAAWRYSESWDQAMFGLRLGDNPQAVVTTTPKPVPALKALLKDPHTVITRASTYDNRANLADAFFDAIITKYEGTRLGRQELDAEMLEDVPGALWTRSLIDATRITSGDVRHNLLVRIVIAVDPAVSSNPDSDEHGIIVAALTPTGHVLIMEDLSLRGSPGEWGHVVVAAYRSRRADKVVGEVNNGGDLVAANLYGIDPSIPFRAVRASRGKYIRAEPVAALYERGLVHHVGIFGALEDQMCGWTPQGTEKSPDRLDALVWAVTELLNLDRDEMPALHVQIAQPYLIS